MRFSNLTYIAIIIGGSAVIMSFIIIYIAYSATINNTVHTYLDNYKNKAYYINSIISINSDKPDKQIVHIIDSIYNAYTYKPADEHICIIDHNAEVIHNIQKQNKDGNSLADNKLLNDNKEEYATLAELVKQKKDFSGYFVSNSGKLQIATFTYVASRNWMLGIHRQEDKLEKEINEIYKWLIYTFLFLAGILLPFALISLFLISRFTNSYRLNMQAEIQNELRESNEKLRIAKRNAEKADKQKSVYLANMSHEIRTPMNGIMGFANLLKNDGLSSEKRNHYVQIINESSQQLLSIINDIIDMSKIESGLMPIVHKEFCVNEELRKIKMFYNHLAEKKGISIFLKTTLPDNEVHIKSDITKFNQIFNNLISNALKFTSTGGIIFGYTQDDDMLQFYVKDTGIGIAEELQEIIFQRFKQADITITQNYGGTGLGLAITKAYVNLLGGEMELESEKGSGATFRFTIPFDKIEPNKIHTVKRKADASDFSNLKILIVDDEKVNFLYLNEILEPTGATLLKAVNGKEAVEICKKTPDLDIILMDIKMPVMNGYEALKEIKKINTEVLIFAQTAFAMLEDKNKVLNAGFDGYLPKPIERKQLIELIKTTK